jgi:hypothetical protein
VGVLVVPDPDNFHTSWWHARDYGLLVANPFGRKALTGGEKSSVIVRRGEKLRLRFGVLIHAAEAEGRFDPAAAARDVLELLKGSAATETIKYLRPSPKGVKEKGFEDETEIRLDRDTAGPTITSVTRRGEGTLTLTSRYDADDRLREATVRWQSKSGESAAKVTRFRWQSRGRASRQTCGDFRMPEQRDRDLCP